MNPTAAPLVPTTMAPPTPAPGGAGPTPAPATGVPDGRRSELERKLDDLMKQLKSQVQALTTPAPGYPAPYHYYPPPTPYPYQYQAAPATTPAPVTRPAATVTSPVASPGGSPAAAASPATVPTSTPTQTTLVPMSATPKPDGIAAQALRKLYRGAAAGPAARQPDAVSTAAVLYRTDVEQPNEPVSSHEFDPFRPSPSSSSLARKEQEAWERAHSAAQGLAVSSLDSQSPSTDQRLELNEKPSPPLLTLPEGETDPYQRLERSQ